MNLHKLRLTTSAQRLLNNGKSPEGARTVVPGRCAPASERTRPYAGPSWTIWFLATTTPGCYGATPPDHQPVTQVLTDRYPAPRREGWNAPRCWNSQAHSAGRHGVVSTCQGWTPIINGSSQPRQSTIRAAPVRRAAISAEWASGRAARAASTGWWRVGSEGSSSGSANRLPKSDGSYQLRCCLYSGPVLQRAATQRNDSSRFLAAYSPVCRWRCPGADRAIDRAPADNLRSVIHTWIGGAWKYGLLSMIVRIGRGACASGGIAVYTRAAILARPTLQVGAWKC